VPVQNLIHVRFGHNLNNLVVNIANFIQVGGFCKKDPKISGQRLGSEFFKSAYLG